MDRSFRQRINKATEVLNDTIEQLDLIDVFRTLHSKKKKAEHAFFLNADGIFSRIEHMLGQKVSFGSFNKIEILSSIFSDHNTMKLDINYKKKKKN